MVAIWLLQPEAGRVITLRTIANLSQNSIAGDHGKGAVSGFGVRRQSGNAVSYVIKYRTVDGRQRWATVGRHGAPWTPDLARAEAKRVLGEVVGGGDPARVKLEARMAATVAELCDAYLEAAKAGRILTRRKAVKKAATLDGDRGRIERHIKPLLGSLKVAAVTRDESNDSATACPKARRPPSSRRASMGWRG